MRRREFVKVLGSVGIAWPLVARAQQPAVPIIGFLHSASAEPNANLVKAFRKGLFDAGFVESQNVTMRPFGSSERSPPLQLCSFAGLDLKQGGNGPIGVKVGQCAPNMAVFVRKRAGRPGRV